jgi:hypothetical protein
MGDTGEAKATLGELHKLRPEFNSFAGLRANVRASPQYAALAAKTVDLGLRRAGLPEE